MQAGARRHRALWPAAAIVVVTIVAYHLTLASLFDYMRLETPLAYLPLLVIFATASAFMTAARYRLVSAPVRDWQTDVLVGLPMVLVAVVLVVIVPPLASTYYWSSRPDVLSMALFVAGLVTLFYGVTWLWRVKASLFFLALMWPALYLTILPGVMQSFTDATNSILANIVQRLPLGVMLTGAPGVLSVRQPSGTPLVVSVSTACSGADSVLGFLLIGGAILTAVGPGRMRKLAWLLVGLTVAFVVNIGRLTSILALVAGGHPSLALGGYHAVIGLILFGLVLAVMIRLLPLFGLRPRLMVADDRDSTIPQAPPAAKPTSRRRVRVKAVVVAGLVLLLGAANHELEPYAAFQNGTGAPTVRPFSIASAPDGWHIRYQAQYPWARQYFGSAATFTRYLVRDSSIAGAATPGSRPPGYAGLVYADVVRTDDKGSLDAYNLQNCFLFHGYDIVTSIRVDVGNGVTGLLLNYSDRATQARWSTVSWAWPVALNGRTHYERIALTSSLAAAAGDSDVSPSGGLHGVLINALNLLNGARNDPRLDVLYRGADTRLQSVAAALVARAISSQA